MKNKRYNVLQVFSSWFYQVSIMGKKRQETQVESEKATMWTHKSGTVV